MNKVLFLLISIVTLCSCRANLDDIPFSDEAEVQSFYMEYRYIDDQGRAIYDAEVLDSEPIINSDSAKIRCYVKEQYRDKTLAGIISITPGAYAVPLGNAPRLGVPTSWENPLKYQITAPDGTTQKTWTIIVENTKKISSDTIPNGLAM